jgi:hypothetical protein
MTARSEADDISRETVGGLAEGHRGVGVGDRFSGHCHDR